MRFRLSLLLQCLVLGNYSKDLNKSMKAGLRADEIFKEFSTAQNFYKILDCLLLELGHFSKNVFLPTGMCRKLQESKEMLSVTQKPQNSTLTGMTSLFGQGRDKLFTLCFH